MRTLMTNTMAYLATMAYMAPEVVMATVTIIRRPWLRLKGVAMPHSMW